MPVTVIAGAQWGDEGKGKIVDYCAQGADLVVRFQGGDNAGHTVCNALGTFKLHLIPCGIFNSKCINLIGTGTVVNPDVVLEEIEMLRKKGIAVDNLRISDRAQILMPYHTDIDVGMEDAAKSSRLGTTLRGIGPAYADKALRTGLRMGDLRDLGSVERKVTMSLSRTNSLLGLYGKAEWTVDRVLSRLELWASQLGPMIVDAYSAVQEAVKRNKSIVFEGQLGAMRDCDQGAYPYVTSSHTLAAYAAVSAGIPAKRLDKVVGVVKAFASQVGVGYLPTQMPDEIAALIRGEGSSVDDEFGARTGRARSLGWLSLPELAYSNEINGFDELALCKLDKLDSLKSIPICTVYKCSGKQIGYLSEIGDWEHLEPVYEEMPGWETSTRNVKRFADLPDNAKRYVAAIEDAVKVPVTMLGVGPHRDDLCSR